MSTEIPGGDPALPHEAPGVPAVLEADHVPQLVAHEGPQLLGACPTRALEDADVGAIIAPVVDLGPLPVGPDPVRPVDHVDLHPAFRAQVSAVGTPPPNGVGKGALHGLGPAEGPPPPDGDGGEELSDIFRARQMRALIRAARMLDEFGVWPDPTPDPQQGKKEGDPHDPSIGESAPDRKLDGGSGG